MQFLKVNIVTKTGGLEDKLTATAIAHERIIKVVELDNNMAEITLADEVLTTNNLYVDIIDRLGWYELDKIKLAREQIELNRALKDVARAATKFFTYKEYELAFRQIARAIEDVPNSAEIRKLLATLQELVKAKVEQD